MRNDRPAVLGKRDNGSMRLPGCKKSPNPVRTYLHREALRYRKVAPIPSKANPEIQETFLTDPREPTLAEAQAGLRHVFFVGALLGYLWGLTRMFVPTSPGRQRFSVLGALPAITDDTFTNTDYIHTTSVATLRRMIHEKFHDLPLTMVLDNAAYPTSSYGKKPQSSE
ncbi:MAG: hypothetical protein M1318_05195 [Firmicutes bacterium]|nr:hypothetical protein [Bacillota bacterium]